MEDMFITGETSASVRKVFASEQVLENKTVGTRRMGNTWDCGMTDEDVMRIEGGTGVVQRPAEARMESS